MQYPPPLRFRKTWHMFDRGEKGEEGRARNTATDNFIGAGAREKHPYR